MFLGLHVHCCFASCCNVMDEKTQTVQQQDCFSVYCLMINVFLVLFGKCIPLGI